MTPAEAGRGMVEEGMAVVGAAMARAVAVMAGAEELIRRTFPMRLLK